MMRLCPSSRRWFGPISEIVGGRETRPEAQKYRAKSVNRLNLLHRFSQSLSWYEQETKGATKPRRCADTDLVSAATHYNHLKMKLQRLLYVQHTRQSRLKPQFPFKPMQKGGSPRDLLDIRFLSRRRQTFPW